MKFNEELEREVQWSDDDAAKEELDRAWRHAMAGDAARLQPYRGGICAWPTMLRVSIKQS